MTARLSPVKKIVLLALFASAVAVPPLVPTTADGAIPTIAQARSSTLEARGREIVGWLGTNDFVKIRSALSPRLQPLWSTEKIQKVWNNQVIEHSGPLRKIVRTRLIDALNAKLLIVTVEFEKLTGDVILTFDDAGQVIAADFPEFRDIEQIAETFVRDLALQDFAAARGYLSPLLKAEIFPERVRSAWENLLRRTGRFQRIAGTQVRKGSDADGVDLVLVTIRFEERTDTLILVFDDEKRIVNVDFPLDR